MAANPVIVLEFNELTPTLIDRFIGDGDLPNFARFRHESQVFTTEAEERPPNLEPWIQWVTVHSGLPYRDHGVFLLDEGHKLQAKRTWEILSDEGLKVWVCGSMNANARNSNGANGCLLPDPWCTQVKPRPLELVPYFRFVQQNVLEHTNDRVPLGLTDYLQFAAFMVLRGLSAATARAILSQLLAERRTDCRWKRVVLLDMLQFDLFSHYYRSVSPAFSTFFLNSTAHYQHAYWDSMEPEHFAGASSSQKAQYRNAIRFGYQKMDVLLGRFMKLASTDATLILCTALSQQPSIDCETTDGGSFYRPKNFVEFAEAIELPGQFTVAPVMSEQFHLEFRDTGEADAAARRLGTMTVDGSQMMAVQQTGARIFAGCRIRRALPQDTAFVVDGKRIPFFDLFYRMDTGKTGVHHPDGILWIRLPDRRHQRTDIKVPLTAVAPTILQLFGVSAPSYMTTPPLRLRDRSIDVSPS